MGQEGKGKVFVWRQFEGALGLAYPVIKRSSGANAQNFDHASLIYFTEPAEYVQAFQMGPK